MAWFTRKGKNGGENGDNGGGDNNVTFAPQPEKARAWFDRARVAADSRQYEYAIKCYLDGIKFDPSNLTVHEDLFKVAALHRGTGGKPASSKDLREIAGEKRPVDKLAVAEMAWVLDPTSPSHALKFMQMAAQLDLHELGYWVGEKGLVALSRHKKPTKALFIGFVDAFEQLGAWEKAVECGEFALKLDPTDGQLVGRIRNLSAQATMAEGKYEDRVGEEGGFRGSVRDLESQAQIIEDEAITTGEDAQSRRLGRAAEDYNDEPTDQGNITRYADLLRKDGTDESDKMAMRVYLQGFKDTGQYRFRMQAGDVKLALERRKLRALRDKAEETGNSEDAERAESAAKKLLEIETSEYAERVEKYPTDLGLKYEYGSRLYQQDRFEEAIPILQESLTDKRNRAEAQHLIGLCFLKEEWYEEAIESLRSAVSEYELKDDEVHLAMRYDLMNALEHYARDHEDLDTADEAAKLASGIAMKQLNFRDIRQRREAIRELIKELRRLKKSG